MVNFSCDQCGAILKKRQVSGHFFRCEGETVSCLDCQKVFWGNDFELHNSCITEAEKYQGNLYQGKKQGDDGEQAGDQSKKRKRETEPEKTEDGGKDEGNKKKKKKKKGKKEDPEKEGENDQEGEKDTEESGKKKKKKHKKRKVDNTEGTEDKEGSEDGAKEEKQESSDSDSEALSDFSDSEADAKWRRKYAKQKPWANVRGLNEKGEPIMLRFEITRPRFAHVMLDILKKRVRTKGTTLNKFKRLVITQLLKDVDNQLRQQFDSHARKMPEAILIKNKRLKLRPGILPKKKPKKAGWGPLVPPAESAESGGNPPPLSEPPADDDETEVKEEKEDESD